MDTANLCFNVIFVPGTVKLQRLGVLSLLFNSRCRFALVANGLSDEEALMLRECSEASDRLEFIDLPCTTMLPHGICLDLLMLRCRTSTFCFADSDLFADQDFASDLQEQSRSADVFSSCGRIEDSPGAIYQGTMGGSTTLTSGGLPLATSFFCVYEAASVRAASSKWQIGFRQYWRPAQLPAVAVDRLRAAGVEERRFDTGKLMSLMHHLDGYRLAHSELPGLTHIGGLSARHLRDDPPPVDAPLVIDNTNWAFVDDLAVGQNQVRNRSEIEKSRKRLLARFFHCWLLHLVDGTPQPFLRVDDAELTGRIERITGGMQATRDHFSDLLR